MLQRMTRAGSGLLAAIGVSLALHGVAYLLLHWTMTLPDVGFTITMPATVSFGVAEGASAPSSPAKLAAAPPSAPSVAASQAVAAPREPRPPGEAPAKPKKPRKPKPETQQPDAGVPSPAAQDEQAPALAAYAPRGAQLALRLDMDRLRASPLAPEARQLLAAIPDFAAILAGSGVDPIDDLSRLFLASPNLERSSLVLAGRYLGGEQVPRRAVESLALAHGKEARWHKLQGIPVAPWQNADETERVLALIGPKLFAITRPEDLSRVLGVAHALQARAAQAAGASDADALLAMQDSEVVALSVENAKSFVQGPTDNVPERIRVSIQMQPDGSIAIHAEGHYAAPNDASRALRFWQSTRDQLAHHPLVALVGMSQPLQDMTLEAKEERLEASTSLSLDQVRLILGFVRDALIPRPRNTAQSAPEPAKSQELLKPTAPPAPDPSGR